MDREQIFQWILAKDWKSLIVYLRANPKAAQEDEIVDSAVRNFIAEFIRQAKANRDAKEYGSYLDTLFLLHRQKELTLATEQFEAIAAEIVERTEDLSLAVVYARAAPNDPVCAAALKRHKAEREAVAAEEAKQTRHAGLRVTENAPIAGVDHRTSLFKSRQEMEFFLAVREVFPMYTVYPNVAISSVISFDGVKASLTESERSYFFRAILDCVVFDILGQFRPSYFIELDSAIHDDFDQKQRDAMKDNILAAAGQRLVRIRKTTPTAGREEFAALVRAEFGGQTA